ncbi:MAG: NADH:ubiquinone reductase (Na(+)-transporting) subunit B [Bacteroidales bacterium]|nr:NADH:ubiquinone reductase (Na(+)-transporting) subunit B [Bacteroidales bacterium]
MGLRNYIDKIKPNFEEDGKFAKFHSTFEAFETFLYTPNRVTNRGAHIRHYADMKRNMIYVLIALIPCFLFGTWNIGYQHFLSLGEDVTFWHTFGYGLLKIIPLYLVSYIVGLIIEFTFAEIRHEEVNEGYFVTGFLIPLIMPVEVPLWMLALAVAFAVIIGKEVFGGSGMNVVNPALLARAFLFFAYPSKMTGDSVWIAEKADAYSGATPLGTIFNGGTVNDLPSLTEMFIGTIPGSIGETSKIAILIGAIFLILNDIISLRIIAATFLGAVSMGLFFNALGTTPAMEVPYYYHLWMGGFLFGTFFMATDPVTAAQTNIGKWIYGFLVGAIAILIRVANPGYPEGMMLSILLMNVFAPLIDWCVVAVNIRKRKKRWAAAERRTK